MNKIANYKCNISASDFDFPGIKIEEINEIGKNSIFPHEVLIWNNNYEFSNLKAFPNLKVFINWVHIKILKTKKRCSIKILKLKLLIIIVLKL